MNVATASLGWYTAAALVAGWTWACTETWVAGQYEITRRGLFRFRVTRRWYGTRAHVRLRGAADNDKAERYFVVRWEDEGTPVPWLLVEGMDDDYTARWAPVTDFAPYTVRRVRPHFERFGRLPILWLTRYLPLRQPAGYLGGGA